MDTARKAPVASSAATTSAGTVRTSNLDTEPHLAAALERLGATYEVIRIDPGFADTAAFDCP